MTAKRLVALAGLMVGAFSLTAAAPSEAQAWYPCGGPPAVVVGGCYPAPVYYPPVYYPAPVVCRPAYPVYSYGYYPAPVYRGGFYGGYRGGYGGGFHFSYYDRDVKYRGGRHYRGHRR